METWRYGNIENGNMEILKYGKMEIRIYGNMKIWKKWKYGNMEKSKT